MKHEWGIGESKSYSSYGNYSVTFYLPVLADGKLHQHIEKYGTMSYWEAQAISKLLNSINQGECK